MKFVVLEITFIMSSILLVKYSLTVCHVIIPLTFVKCPIRPYLLPLSLTFSIFYLTIVFNSTLKKDFNFTIVSFLNFWFGLLHWFFVIDQWNIWCILRLRCRLRIHLSFLWIYLLFHVVINVWLRLWLKDFTLVAI